MNTTIDYARLWREQVLLRVQKPARYIGGEWNQINKDPEHVKTRMVLAFPDVYEIGVSYLGYHILYELLNQDPLVYAERAYSPWVDAEEILRAEKIPLCSLETGTPLSGFHWVGITLQHELSYTNVLNLLDLGQIPIRAKDRSESAPLVVAGGPGAANPEPIAEVFDLIVLGDGEEVIMELMALERTVRHLPRQERLRALAQIPGVYAPGFYTPSYGADQRVERITAEPGMPFPIQRRIAPAPALPQKPLVPFLGVTHDRVSVELFRGCARGCRFCQAGMINRPVREREPNAVLEQMLSSLRETGYEEASFTSLSSGDYSQLVPLVDCLMKNLAEEQVALSFPSLRLDSFKRELAEMVRAVRKTGLTFAPEAGSSRMWNVMNKSLDDAGLTANIAEVFAEGWDLVKLYFMVGLPTETMEDVLEINRLVRRIFREAQQGKSTRRNVRMNLSINLFVPKPHTPFQWEGQLSRAETKARLQRLAQELPRAAGFMFGKRGEEDLNRSYLEAVLARGDRKLFPALYRTWELGARFDSWGDQFRFDLWEQAFKECGLNPDDYALRERSLEEVLPWSHLHMGVETDYLKKELARAKAGIQTADCQQTNTCNGCGVAEPSVCPPPMASALTPRAHKPAVRLRPEREAVRLRLGYRKTGDLRFVGHLDLVNLFRRASRRAGLPLHYSLGFHPQPSLSFGPPLPLGMEGLCEWVDLGLDAWQDPQAVRDALNKKMPQGIRIEVSREVPLRTPSLNEQVTGGEYRLVFPDSAAAFVREQIRVLLASTEIMATQWSKSGLIQVNIRPAVVNLEMLPDQPQAVSLLHSTELPKSAKITTLIDYLRGPEVPAYYVHCIRIASGKLYNGKIVVP